MTWWWLKHRLKGFQTVDCGVELTEGMAVELACDTARRYGKGRAIAINVRGRKWSVMVKGWNPKKEDG